MSRPDLDALAAYLRENAAYIEDSIAQNPDEAETFAVHIASILATPATGDSRPLTYEQARKDAAGIDDVFGLTEEQRRAAAERDVAPATADSRPSDPTETDGDDWLGPEYASALADHLGAATPNGDEVWAAANGVPVLKLTGEQIGSIEPPPDRDWFTDFDEYELFVPLRMLREARGNQQ